MKFDNLLQLWVEYKRPKNLNFQNNKKPKYLFYLKLVLIFLRHKKFHVLKLWVEYQRTKKISEECKPKYLFYLKLVLILKT